MPRNPWLTLNPVSLTTTAIGTVAATAVVAANAIHPLLHSAEGGALDQHLAHANLWLGAWLDSKLGASEQ